MTAASQFRVLQPIQCEQCSLELAASKLPAAAAAQVVLPRGGFALVTAVSVLIVLSLINSNAITGPRVLFSMAREGWISQKAAAVNGGGTPYVALATTTLMSAAMILTGTFNQLIALFAVLNLLYYIAAFLAVFVLRRRSPEAQRPYRAYGYPISTFLFSSDHWASYWPQSSRIGARVSRLWSSCPCVFRRTPSPRDRAALGRHNWQPS